MTKSIHASIKVKFKDDDPSYQLYTSNVLSEDLERIPEKFFPTLVQEKIEKDVEIRTFIIEDDIYSMAIFSQLDPKTKDDFREYNFDKMNRMVPFKLPKHIEKKLLVFMKLVDLNTGSIDIIKTPENEYIFLEINPTGQYGFVSGPCNYHLNREIAKKLINAKTK